VALYRIRSGDIVAHLLVHRIEDPASFASHEN
jgi:hypothetical protein